MKNNFQIWPLIKKVWPPLLYNIEILEPLTWIIFIGYTPPTFTSTLSSAHMFCTVFSTAAII